MAFCRRPIFDHFCERAKDADLLVRMVGISTFGFDLNRTEIQILAVMYYSNN